jgi:hypothetical protein
VVLVVQQTGAVSRGACLYIRTVAHMIERWGFAVSTNVAAAEQAADFMGQSQ